MYDTFCGEYEYQKNEELKQLLSQAGNDPTLKRLRSKKSQSAVGKSAIEGSGYAIAFVGMFVLFGGCVCLLATNSFVPLLLGIVLTAGGFLFGLIKGDNQKGKIDQLDNEIKAREQQLKDEYAADISRYFSNYEAKIIERSLDFTESEHAKEISELVAADIIHAVQQLERPASCDKVQLIEAFVVKADAFDRHSLSGTSPFYNFEEHRAAQITDPLDRAAITHAIAMLVKLAVHQQMETDPSGTDYILEETYHYDRSNTYVSFEYKAPNGNYKAKSAW